MLAGWNARLSNPPRDRSGYAFSFDGGLTWQDSLIEREDEDHPLGIDPSVAFDRHGNAFFCHVGGTGLTSEDRVWIRVWKRALPSGNWQQQQVSIRLPAFPVPYNDKPYMAVDNSGFTSPGNIYVAWTEYDWPVENWIKFNRSMDGQTFDTLAVTTLDVGNNTVQVDDPSFISLLGALPVVGPTGELYVFWTRGSSTAATVAFRKSTDGGETWSPPLGSDPASTVQFRPRFALNYGHLQSYTFPSAAIDTTGVVYLAFSAVPPNAPDSVVTVYLTKSTDGGTTWSDTIKTNQTASGLRFMPWLTVDRWNALHLVYYHGPGQNLANAYIASLLNNESTFEYPDIRLNEITINASQIGRPMHYIGMTANASGDVLPCWTDTRNGAANKGDSYASRLNLSSPRAPVLTQPPNRAPLTTDNLNFSWTAAFGARQYRFELDDDPSFGSPFIDLVSSTEYQYTGDPLIIDIPYYWRVRSENDLGVGPYSDTSRFIVRDAIEREISYLISWNLASVPLYLRYFHADSVWRPSSVGGPRVGGPFIYDPASGYASVSELANGAGYWVKFSPAPTISYSGGWWDTLEVPVATNWNIIGSIHAPVDTSTIRYVGAVRASSYFKYENGYSPVGSLQPGFGYWVKFSPGGTIRLIGNAPPSSGGEDELLVYDKFTITDAGGKQQDLYVRNGERPSDYVDQYWEMPPVPPGQSFDVRLGTDMFVKTVDPTPEPVDLTFLMTGVEFPVTLSWQINPENGITYSLPDTGGGLGKGTSINGTGSLKVSRISKNIRLKAMAAPRASVPAEFVLKQNYPNPFNSSTEIRYALPRKSHVRLVLYDLLGREVARLVDSEKESGYHTALLNASNLSSGMYFYRMHAGSYVAVRKLVVLK